MNKITSDPPMLEELTHLDHRFPVTEFVDHFDTFADGTFPSHWHPEFELHYVISGAVEYLINGVTYVVEKGAAMYIAPESIHLARQLTAGTVSYNVVLLPQFLITLLTSIQCEEFTLPLTTRQPEALVIYPLSKEGYKIIDRLKIMYSTENTQETYKLLMLEKLIGIWRFLFSLFPKETVALPDNKILIRNKRMKEMLDYIHKNYAQPITIQDIAGAANISKSECFRCFSELSQMTPVEYLNDYRLLKASKLLTTTEKNIADICYEVGFNSTSYFSKRFRSQYKMSPKDYRMKKRGS